MKRSNDINTRSITTDPSTNGRTARGHFAKGNPGGPGNPYARRTAALRSALLDAVTEKDIHAAVRALISKAKSGDIAAIRELLNRLLGRVPEATESAESEPPPMPDMSEEALQAVARSLCRRCDSCDCPRCSGA